MASPEILSTRDYTLFKTIKGNRKVRDAHVNKLRVLIDQDPESIKLSPILVNERMEVIDGQHRLAAISQLGLEVYYIKHKGLDISNVRALNSSAKQWQPVDYAYAFAESGNVNYQLYLKAKDSDYKVNHDCLIRYLSLDNPVTNSSFKLGALKVDNFQRTMELLEMLYAFASYPRFKTRNFALAFLRFATDEQYDHDRMVKQITNHIHRLEDKATERDYFEEINRIYNFSLAEDKKIIFGTAEYLSRAAK